MSVDTNSTGIFVDATVLGDFGKKWPTIPGLRMAEPTFILYWLKNWSEEFANLTTHFFLDVPGS